MEKFKNIDAEVQSDSNVVIGKQNPIVHIIILISSVLIAYLSIKHIGDNSVTYGIVFMSFILAVIGLKGVFVPKRILRYTKTGEVLKRKEAYFDYDSKAEVCNNVNEGRIENLVGKHTGDHGRVKVIYYITPSLSYSVMQVLEYIPYEYSPISKIQVVAKGV